MRKIGYLTGSIIISLLILLGVFYSVDKNNSFVHIEAERNYESNLVNVNSDAQRVEITPHDISKTDDTIISSNESLSGASERSRTLNNADETVEVPLRETNWIRARYEKEPYLFEGDNGYRPMEEIYYPGSLQYYRRRVATGDTGWYILNRIDAILISFCSDEDIPYAKYAKLYDITFLLDKGYYKDRPELLDSELDAVFTVDEKDKYLLVIEKMRVNKDISYWINVLASPEALECDCNSPACICEGIWEECDCGLPLDDCVCELMDPLETVLDHDANKAYDELYDRHDELWEYKEELIPLLDHPHPVIREWTLRIFAKANFPDPNLSWKYVENCNHWYSDVRWAAMNAIEALGHYDNVIEQTLIRIVREDEYSGCREKAVEALGSFGPLAVNALPTIREAMNVEEGPRMSAEAVRTMKKAAMEAIARIEDK
ncbi:MAG: HEAT repeat domain-containing protein [Planctomycetes bacterium]|nr:HEAT repeat domain-containing protein [Planctomycetota bacterium]